MQLLRIERAIALAIAFLLSACVAAIDEDEVTFACDKDADCPGDLRCIEVDFTDMCKPLNWCNEDDHCDDDEQCDLDANECDDYDNCPGYYGSNDCCVVEDICDLEWNDICDCGGNCEWDEYDCS